MHGPMNIKKYYLIVWWPSALSNRLQLSVLLLLSTAFSTRCYGILLLLYVFEMSPVCAVSSVLTVLLRPTKALYLYIIRCAHVRYGVNWLVLFMTNFYCFASGRPALGPLHQSDAIGPGANGGPALMGNSRISHF